MEKQQLSFIDDEWIIEATIDDLQDAMETGKTTCYGIVSAYLKRIALHDKSNISINSILEVNPDALHIASALDIERKEKGPRGPLHGIPVVLKDNINTCDKMSTSAGTLSLSDSKASMDAYITSKLRDAGAVILAKANMTELANFMTENMPNGYSSRGGQVLNPYGPGKFDVGGSSSGSAASVASNLTAVAVGTETSGSILNPATKNSVVGIKPTLGLISRTGIIPIAHSQDTAGPIARTVKDAAILLGILMGRDERDPSTMSIPCNFINNFTDILDKEALKGVRIGIPEGNYFEGLDPDSLKLFKNAVEVLTKKGAVITDNVKLSDNGILSNYDVLIYEFKGDLNDYLKNLGPNIPVHSLKEIIEFNDLHSEETLKYGQTILLQSENTSGNLTEPEYIENLLRDQYFSREQGIDLALKKYNLDVLLFPSYFGCSMAAKAGYPSVTVPAGYPESSEPMSITFTGTAFSEHLLIKLAYAFEQATLCRIPPKL